MAGSRREGVAQLRSSNGRKFERKIPLSLAGAKEVTDKIQTEERRGSSPLAVARTEALTILQILNLSLQEDRFFGDRRSRDDAISLEPVIPRRRSRPRFR